MAKKKKQNKKTNPTTSEDKISLKDQLQDDVFSKLKTMKSTLEQTEQKRKEEEEARKREEHKQREKNKSFEELLDESSLDWKKYK